MSNLGIIIQARTGATRMPNKTILPFYNGKGILELLIERLMLLDINIPLIVATTTNKNDDKIATLVSRLDNVHIFRGSENNVLKRYINAAIENGIDKIIRICADNPFLDIYELEILINQFSAFETDYLGFEVANKPSIKTHYGFWAEAVNLEALLKISAFTNEKIFLEHVTNFVYENKDKFNVDFIKVNKLLPNYLRLTLDTYDDFEIQKEIYKDLVHLHGMKFRLADILKYLSVNPEYFHVMQKQINEQSK